MNIQGELDITLSRSSDRSFQSQQSECQIKSTRPLQVTEIFSGKSIDYTLKTLPIVFSICSKAQSVTAIQAIESATNRPVSKRIESNREALIALESLREQCLRIFMDWPSYINDEVDNVHLSHVAMGINHLIKSLEPKTSLSFPAKEFIITSNHTQAWKQFSEALNQALFSQANHSWGKDLSSYSSWVEKQANQVSRFLYWLDQQQWKYDGTSSITHLPKIDDHELVNKLTSDNNQFISSPDWNNHCYELSWFSRLLHNPANPFSNLANQLVDQHGNGILVRMIARLLEVANLMNQLDSYFIKHDLLESPISNHVGLAHSNAARGKLSHYVEVEGSTINRLMILAPTEWNFHPQGVAADSLRQLVLNSTKETDALKKQAELMIHAIDPCVGYKLHVESGHHNNRVIH